MNTVRLGAAFLVNGELDAANGQDTRRTWAPLTSPLFSSTKARFASVNSYSWILGSRGTSAARRGNGVRSEYGKLGVFFPRANRLFSRASLGPFRSFRRRPPDDKPTPSRAGSRFPSATPVKYGRPRGFRGHHTDLRLQLAVEIKFTNHDLGRISTCLRLRRLRHGSECALRFRGSGRESGSRRYAPRAQPSVRPQFHRNAATN
jgi:hypothetical protein